MVVVGEIVWPPSSLAGIISIFPYANEKNDLLDNTNIYKEIQFVNYFLNSTASQSLKHKKYFKLS